MSPLSATAQTYKNTKTWLEIHAIVPTLLAMVTLALTLIFFAISSSRNASAQGKIAGQQATAKGFTQYFCPLAANYMTLKPSDPTSATSVANTAKVVKGWTDLAHFLGCK